MYGVLEPPIIFLSLLSPPPPLPPLCVIPGGLGLEDDEVGDDEDAHNPYANPVTYRDLSDQDEGGSSYEEEEEPPAGEEGVAEDEVRMARGCARRYSRAWAAPSMEPGARSTPLQRVVSIIVCGFLTPACPPS